MKYSIDVDYRYVTIQLEPKNKLGYTNVPLARAILRRSPQAYLDTDKRNVNATFVFNGARLPEVTFQAGFDEVTDQEFIKNVGSKAQQWLAAEMTRLEALRDSLETLEIAFPREHSNED